MEKVKSLSLWVKRAKMSIGILTIICFTSTILIPNLPKFGTEFVLFSLGFYLPTFLSLITLILIKKFGWKYFLLVLFLNAGTVLYLTDYITERLIVG